MKRRALAAVPLALGLAALLLVPAWLCGCGKKEQPPRERLEAAAEAAREAGSAHAQLFVSVSPREGERGTSMNVQGDVWADMQAGNMEARLTVLGMEVAARYVEGRAYVRFGGQWYVLEGEIAQGVDEEAVTALAGLLGAAPEIVSAAEEVEKVEVHTYAMAVVAVGKGRGERDTFVSAQFSIPYVVAAAVLDREVGPRQLTAERRADPALRELMSRVEVRLDEELQAAYPEKTASRVEMLLRDGSRLARQVDIPRGDPRDPMREEDVREKLMSFAGGGDRGRLERLADLVLRTEELADLTAWTELV